MEIAIIDPNTVASVGLQSLIAEVAPDAVVRRFSDFGAFVDDTPDMYDFCFVTSQSYLLHNWFFLPRKSRIVILINGSHGVITHSSHLLLNVNAPRKMIVDSLSSIIIGKTSPGEGIANYDDLTSREIEVLVMIARGMQNKEIADKLNISLTTVITHRKNITAKLGIKSVSGLTIYAVACGYLSPDAV